MEEVELTKWARDRAAHLRSKTEQRSNEKWREGSQLRPLVSRELEFLRIQAPKSAFHTSAESIFLKANYPSFVFRSVADVLDDWAEHVEEGFATADPFEVRFRTAAATDLMEQAQLLVMDRKMHPAAPVLIACAALEEFLRGLFQRTTETIPGNPGIAKYAEALKRADVIDAQDVKDITSWAGQRNDAAHGNFTALSKERAQLLLDGINLFMRKYKH